MNYAIRIRLLFCNAVPMQNTTASINAAIFQNSACASIHHRRETATKCYINPPWSSNLLSEDPPPPKLLPRNSANASTNRRIVLYLNAPRERCFSRCKFRLRKIDLGWPIAGSTGWATSAKSRGILSPLVAPSIFSPPTFTKPRYFIAMETRREEWNHSRGSTYASPG